MMGVTMILVQPRLMEATEASTTEVKIQILVMVLILVQMLVEVEENSGGIEPHFLRTNWKN